MATEKIEFELELTGDKKVDRALKKIEGQFRKVDGALDKNSQAAKKSSDSFDKLAGSFTVAAAKAQFWFEIVSKAVTALKDFAEWSDRVGDIYGNLQGDITEAANATKGLVANMDLAIARNKLQASGLQVSAKDFANVSKAATIYAEKVGIDVNQALDQMVDGLASRSPDAMIKFGVAVADGTKKSEVFEEQVKALNKQFGQAQVNADSTGDKFTILGNKVVDLTESFIQSLPASTAVNDSFDEMMGWLDSLATEVPKVAMGMVTFFDFMTGAVGGLAAALAQLVQGNLEEAKRIAASATDIEAPIARLRERLGQLGGTGNVQRRFDRNAAPGGSSRDLRSGTFAANETAGGAGEPDTTRRDQQDLFNDIMGPGQQSREQMAENSESFVLNTDKMFTLAGAVDEVGKAFNDTAEEIDAADIMMEGFGVSAQDAANLITDAFESGPAEALANFAEAFSQKMLLLALEQAGMAIAAFASYRYDAGVQHTAAAAAFGVAAAAAGGAASAIRPDSGGGENSRATPSRRDEDRDGGGDTGTIVVNFNSPVTEAEMGRLMNRAQRTARRRFA